MKYIILIALVFVLAIAHPLEEVNNSFIIIFLKIDKSNFGKSLLDTVNLQLNSAQSVDQLLKVLDDMRDTMNSQKEGSEKEHQDFQHDCGKDIDFYQQEIAQATTLIVDSQRGVDQANEELKIVQSLLDQVFQQMKIFQQALTKLNDIRISEAKDFKQSMDEHDITTTAIQESKRYFVQIRGEISFLQTRKALLAQLSSHFNNAKTQIKNKKYSALFHIMAQMTSRAPFDNGEVVAKILELCDKVLENVAESRMSEQQDENERIKIFTDKKKVLDNNIFNCQSKINTLEDQKKALEQHISIMSQVLEDSLNRKSQNTQLMQSRKAECDNEIYDYQALRQKSLDQVSIVEKIITLTETNLATMKQYLKERREQSGVKVNMKV